jgi:hypothetical protein
VVFGQHPFNKIDHRDPTSFNVVHNFVAFNFHYLCQFHKFKMPFGAMIKVTIQALQKKFNAKNQR